MKRTLTILFTIFSFAQLQAAIKPNLVFIIADDCTFRDIGCYGGQARTPNIDTLGQAGDAVHPVFSGRADVFADAA